MFFRLISGSMSHTLATSTRARRLTRPPAPAPLHWVVPYLVDRPIRLTQCCTQFKSPRVQILCVLYLHYNVAFTFINDMEIPETKGFIPKGFEWGTALS